MVVDAFEQHIRGGLEQLGVPVSDDEIGIMRFIHALYGPEQERLLNTDFADVFPEHDFCPGRAPTS